ncbi:Fur family transcriptional regulator [Nostocoides veronense]|uniref:Fur family transcriptional regulator FurA3 n=1 Tax=Nostocoides veronense TaxID=330836 RepID=A0ABP4XEW3_9MICO
MPFPAGTEPAAVLRRAGLRVTAPRVATLTELQESRHVDVDSLAGQLRVRLGGVSTQAVYDVLRALSDAGLVRRIEPAGSPARYELDRGDNHHHLVCRGCGALVDVPCATGIRPCLETESSDHGFVVDEAEVIYWGLCPNCQNSVPPQQD